MTAILLLVMLLLYIASAELRIVRRRRADRVATLDALARAAGIMNAVKVGRALGWLGDDDVRSDGDVVRIRLRRRRPWLR